MTKEFFRSLFSLWGSISPTKHFATTRLRAMQEHPRIRPAEVVEPRRLPFFHQSKKSVLLGDGRRERKRRDANLRFEISNFKFEISFRGASSRTEACRARRIRPKGRNQG